MSKAETGLTPKNEHHAGDVRHYGKNQQQLAMDQLLRSWAQTTWKLPNNIGKDFSMRVAENLQAVEDSTTKDAHPQADWKYTKGRVKRGLAPMKPDSILEIVARLVSNLETLDPAQWMTLVIHYGAYWHIDKLHWTDEEKAETLNLTVNAYRKRIVRIRKYVMDYWPKQATVLPPKETVKIKGCLPGNVEV